MYSLSRFTKRHLIAPLAFVNSEKISFFWCPTDCIYPDKKITVYARTEKEVNG